MLLWRRRSDIDGRPWASFKTRVVGRLCGGCRGFNDADVVTPTVSRLRLPLLAAKEAKEGKDTPLGDVSHGVLPIVRDCPVRGSRH